MSILVVSTSLHPKSRSRILAQAACGALEKISAPCQFLDLRELPLPHCDGATTYGDANVRQAAGLVAGAGALLLATPIYNFDASAMAKSFIEHTGRNLEGKVVGFLCAAGGPGSYMSIMSLANSLMLDFRCLVVPRFVYTGTKSHFQEDTLIEPDIQSRIDDLAAETWRLVQALKR